MTDLRLYMFQSGTLKCKLHNIKMNQGLNEPYEIPVPWFFIQHRLKYEKPERETGDLFHNATLPRCERPPNACCRDDSCF
jgi:hypothetical protein